MFKLKAGNVIEKLNKMDRKQAYTYGGIGVGVLVALFLLASFMGNADETSFDDFTARGYDLADSPFATDEAEEFLLASAYPDMQNNNAYTLYGPAERAKREAEDAQAAQASAEEEDNDESSANSSDEGGEGYSYSGRNRYGGRGGRSGGPTQVQQLSGANVSRSNGSDMGSSWGSPRLDTTAFRQNDRAKDTINTSKGGMNAKRALSQFASASQAGAKLKEGKAVNMKRSLMGGDIVGANTNADGTVDLSNVDAAHLDTEAPDASSPDYDNLKNNLSKAADNAKKGEDDNNEEHKDFWDKALEMLAEEAIKGLGKLVSGQLQAWGDDMNDTRELNRQAKNMYNENPMSKQTLDWITAQYKDSDKFDTAKCSTAQAAATCLNALGLDKKATQRAYRTYQRGKK